MTHMLAGRTLPEDEGQDFGSSLLGSKILFLPRMSSFEEQKTERQSTPLLCQGSVPRVPNLIRRT